MLKFLYTITYPTSLDSLANPSAGNALNSPSHATQHANANDAIEALETKVGADGSAVTTSHDYKLSAVTGSDKAVSASSASTLTNKTLSAGTKINISGGDTTGSIYYKDASSNLVALAPGADANILSISGGLPTFIANPSASDASATVKGVVEMATSAEINAGTATGGTGAKLAVGPDQLLASNFLTTGNLGTTANKVVQLDGSAKLPAVDGSALTGVLVTASYVGAITTNNSSTNQNFDTTFTTNFAPKVITIRYQLQGYDSSQSEQSIGIAIYNSAGTLVNNEAFVTNLTGSPSFTAANHSYSTTVPKAGGTGGNNQIVVTLSILSVSAINFVVRVAYTNVGGGPGGTHTYQATAFS
jgi:hypothetical protein